jgi:hypothetical protein
MLAHDGHAYPQQLDSHRPRDLTAHVRLRRHHGNSEQGRNQGPHRDGPGAPATLNERHHQDSGQYNRDSDERRPRSRKREGHEHRRPREEEEPDSPVENAEDAASHEEDGEVRSGRVEVRLRGREPDVPPEIDQRGPGILIDTPRQHHVGEPKDRERSRDGTADQPEADDRHGHRGIAAENPLRKHRQRQSAQPSPAEHHRGRWARIHEVGGDQVSPPGRRRICGEGAGDVDRHACEDDRREHESRTAKPVDLRAEGPPLAPRGPGEECEQQRLGDRHHPKRRHDGHLQREGQRHQHGE